MPFSRMRKSVAKFSVAYVTNCVAPQASDTSTSTGFEKNIAMVARKPARVSGLGETPVCGEVSATDEASSPPRAGSRTLTYTMIAVAIPTAPSTTNALRQL